MLLQLSNFFTLLILRFYLGAVYDLPDLGYVYEITKVVSIWTEGGPAKAYWLVQDALLLWYTGRLVWYLLVHGDGTEISIIWRGNNESSTGGQDIE